MSRAAALLAGILTIAAAGSFVPPVGAVAPDFALLDQNGRRVTLDSARGHKAVLVFYRGYW